MTTSATSRIHDPSSPGGAGSQQPSANGFIPPDELPKPAERQSATMRAVVLLSRIADAQERTRLASELEQALAAGRSIERMLERLEAEGGDLKNFPKVLRQPQGASETRKAGTLSNSTADCGWLIHAGAGERGAAC